VDLRNSGSEVSIMVRDTVTVSMVRFRVSIGLGLV